MIGITSCIGLITAALALKLPKKLNKEDDQVRGANMIRDAMNDFNDDKYQKSWLKSIKNILPFGRS